MVTSSNPTEALKSNNAGLSALHSRTALVEERQPAQGKTPRMKEPGRLESQRWTKIQMARAAAQKNPHRKERIKAATEEGPQ